MNYGGALPPFYSTLTGIAYNDRVQDIVSGPPTYTVYDAQNNIVLPGSLKPGTYQVKPSASPLVAPSNYTANYLPGMLTVIGDPLTIRANDVTITQGSALPVFTSSFTGLKSAGDAAA